MNCGRSRWLLSSHCVPSSYSINLYSGSIPRICCRKKKQKKTIAKMIYLTLMLCNKLIAVRTDVSMKGCRLCLSIYDIKVVVYESTILRIETANRPIAALSSRTTSITRRTRHEYEKKISYTPMNTESAPKSCKFGELSHQIATWRILHHCTHNGPRPNE